MSRSVDEELADLYESPERITIYEKRKEADAKHASALATIDNKKLLSRAFVGCVLVVTVFAGVTTWTHKDNKVREVAVSLIGLPIGAIAGLLGGIGLH
jgi:hypothetical protein